MDSDSRDPRTAEQIEQDAALADEFAEPGTLKHYLLRKGFLPDDEAQAEAILDSIILENERLGEEIERLRARSGVAAPCPDGCGFADCGSAAPPFTPASAATDCGPCPALLDGEVS